MLKSSSKFVFVCFLNARLFQEQQMSRFSVSLARLRETWLYKRKWRFIIGGPLVAYGLNWKWEDFCADRYLQKMVNQALLEGNQPVIDSPIKHVHIILNPVAGGGYARQVHLSQDAD